MTGECACVWRSLRNGHAVIFYCEVLDLSL